MSQKIDVALLVRSRKLTLSELSVRLGRSPQPGSHDKGTPRLKQGSWKATYWRENARNPQSPLPEQCLQLLADMPAKCTELLDSELDDISACLDVAVFFEAAYASVSLPPNVVAEVAAKGLGLEITSYPCDPESPGI